jgi:hypothetical protein
LSHSNNILKARNWYVAHELLYFAPKARRKAKRAKWTVWENLILIKAKSPQHAYQKAMEHGRASEQAVRIDGEHGVCRFRGVGGLNLVYDELEDGAELEWRVLQISSTKLDSLITRKNKMQAFKYLAQKLRKSRD